MTEKMTEVHLVEYRVKRSDKVGLSGAESSDTYNLRLRILVT